MRSTYFPKAMTILMLLVLGSALSAQTDETNTPNPGVSKVRIVRLSQVRGSVQIDRGDGRGFERAIPNLPVVEKNELQTGEGVAEVEFEDNTSLRLAPNSQVEFRRLERSANGATLSSVRIGWGTAYFSVTKANGKAPANDFTVMFGGRKINLDPGTHVRLDLKVTEANLSVLDGAVRLNEGNGVITIPKKKAATFGLFSDSDPTMARNIEAIPFDAWDHEAAAYHANAASLSAFNSPYSYGLRDLSYYGSFVNSPCGGRMWRPYFASAAWDPFANGTWAWYQGAGYSWVSPYPWGWTPFHSGSWSLCNDVGWGWMPNQGDLGWYGINNAAALTPLSRSTGSSGGGVQGPRLPIHPPLPHAPSMIAINTKPVAISQVTSLSSFEFRKDSAGLGVPRATLGNLNKFSRESISRGTASTPIYVNVPRAGQGGGNYSRSEVLGASISRGNSPQPSMNSSYTQGSYSPSYSGSGGGGGGGAAGGGMRGGGGPVSAPAPSAPSGGGGVRK